MSTQIGLHEHLTCKAAEKFERIIRVVLDLALLEKRRDVFSFILAKEFWKHRVVSLFCFLCRSLSFSSWILAEYRTSSSISTENNCEQLRMALDEPEPKRYQRTMRSKKEEYSSGLVSIIAVTTFISRRQRGSIESCILL